MKWKVVILSLIAFGLTSKTQAQYLSADGKFQVDQVKGCADFTITVTPVEFICDNEENSCGAFYENDSESTPLITPPFTHTYTQPGVYTLKVLYGPLSDTITIEVLPNIPPEFDVYTCGGNMVSVKITDTNYDEYVVNYNDGSPLVVLNSGGTNNHQYASSSPQTVTVRGRNVNAADNCNEAGTIVTPLASLPAPTITLLEVLNDESIRLEFDALPNLQYKLGIATNNGTTFQQLKTVYNQSVDTIFNLRTDDNFYCFQLAAFDPCNNTVLNSATICSANTDLSVRNNAIDLKWTTAIAGTSGFSLSRIAGDGTTLVTTPSGSPYADIDVVCGTEYCYRLTTRYPNGSRSLSLLTCGTGFSTDVPTSIQNVSSVAGDNSVALEWLTDPDFTPVEFNIEKATQGGPYAFLAASALNTYTDDTYTGETGSCYRIGYKDACDNQSPAGIEVCPLVLTATLLKDNAINLAWNSYQGWAMGVSGYVVEKYSGDGTLLQTFQAGTATTYVDDASDLSHQSFVYVVKATAAESGVTPSASNQVSVLKNPNLFYPTAFTPNSDNLNDTFTVLGQYVVEFEMKIFNRWGEMLFSTNDITSGWDGTFRGQEMPEGTYTFIAYITDRAGRTFKRSGSVLLLRK